MPHIIFTILAYMQAYFKEHIVTSLVIIIIN